MLDEANVGRFCELLLELSDNTQFILITHNRNTVQVADVIYGVTMGKDSASQVISLKIDEFNGRNGKIRKSAALSELRFFFIGKPAGLG